VIEEDLPLLQIGQPVEVFFDAVPEAAVHGRVARIVPQRLSGEDRPLYPVYITLDERSTAKGRAGPAQKLLFPLASQGTLA
jgi:multidrug resistance efflux pump